MEQYLVKMSYSKTEMWSLTVRSIVDLRAMASKEEWMGWCSCSVARNSRQGTMALQVERVGQEYSNFVPTQVGGKYLEYTLYIYTCGTSVYTILKVNEGSGSEEKVEKKR